MVPGASAGCRRPSDSDWRRVELDGGFELRQSLRNSKVRRAVVNA
jgi:hypothetical protein